MPSRRWLLIALLAALAVLIATWFTPGRGVLVGVGAAGIGVLAAALAVAVVLLVVLAVALAKGASVALYARVTGAHALEHPKRQALLSIVAAEPGIHLKEISRRSGLAWGQTQFHMHRLVKAGAVQAHASAGYKCYFPKEEGRHAMRAAPALKAEGAQRLLRAIVSRPGASLRDLAQAAGLEESTVAHHIGRFDAAGLVRCERGSGSRRTVATPAGEDAVRRLQARAALSTTPPQA